MGMEPTILAPQIIITEEIKKKTHLFPLPKSDYFQALVNSDMAQAKIDECILQRDQALGNCINNDNNKKREESSHF